MRTKSETTTKAVSNPIRQSNSSHRSSQVPVPDFVGEQLEKVPDLVGSAYEELAKEPTPEEVAERKRNEEERRIARDKADKIRAEEMKAMQARKTAVREASEKARQEKLDKINKIREDEEKTRLAKAAADAKALKEAETKKAKVESDRRAAIDKEKSARQAQQSKVRMKLGEKFRKS
jgi:hypothetical protein